VSSSRAAMADYWVFFAGRVFVGNALNPCDSLCARRKDSLWMVSARLKVYHVILLGNTSDPGEQPQGALKGYQQQHGMNSRIFYL